MLTQFLYELVGNELRRNLRMESGNCNLGAALVLRKGSILDWRAVKRKLPFGLLGPIININRDVELGILRCRTNVKTFSELEQAALDLWRCRHRMSHCEALLKRALLRRQRRTELALEGTSMARPLSMASMIKPAR